MSDVPMTRTQLLDALMKITDSHTSDEELTTGLHAAVLAFGSETPDNLNCVKRIEVGRVGDKTGLKVHGPEVLFADMAHVIEDEPMPEALKAAFPDITEHDWEAFTRLTTLIYILLSRTSSPKP